MLASRGLLDDLLAVALARLPNGHFAGLPLDYSQLPTPYPYQIGIPQARVEERLADMRARTAPIGSSSSPGVPTRVTRAGCPSHRLDEHRSFVVYGVHYGCKE